MACALSAPAFAAETAAAPSAPPSPQRVFVCAHSFMTFIADLLPPMAVAGSQDFALAGRQMIGGSRVIQHWDLPADKVKPALRAGLVDTLIVSPTVPLPDAGIDNFTKLGLQTNPKLRVFVQASWPAFDYAGASMEGFQLHAATFKKEAREQATAASLEAMRVSQRDGWCAALKKQVAALNGAIGHEAVRIVPVNEAVFALRQQVVAGTAPGLRRQADLFSDPIGHPTPELKVLVAYCHYAALFDRSPEGLPVPAELKSRGGNAAVLNLLMQKLAWAAVSGK